MKGRAIRLSLTCRTTGGIVRFAWFNPPRHAVVHALARRYAGGSTVRVTTGDGDVGMSRATFVVSEHARDGRRLRAYELAAQVAG
jgi:hypothetical protein